MLGVSAYTKEYIDACRSSIDAQLAAYDQLISTVQPGTDAAASFEPLLFNNLAIVLDRLFVHRLRTLEGKDGNPMNEVRMICNSLLDNNGVFTAEKTIKMKTANTILKHEFGQEIKLTQSDFVQLANAYFAAIESTFM